MDVEYAILFVALALAISTRPWRLLTGGDLLSPMLATLVILPWLWAMPRLHTMPLSIQLSGACAVTLMLGWPLAVITLVAVALIAGFVAPASLDLLAAQALWLGIVPATLALCIGALLRRWFGGRPFVYILGRAFAGSVMSTFLAMLIAMWAGHGSSHLELHDSVLGSWLLSWGDGMFAGMLAAVFVAYRPQWLATWSDSIYLSQKVPNGPT